MLEPKIPKKMLNVLDAGGIVKLGSVTATATARHADTEGALKGQLSGL